MPFLDAIDGNDVNADVFWNVSEAVGNGCPNIVEDVMLVQFFLKRAAEKFPLNKETITVNGVCDSVTIRAIYKFQSTYGSSVDGIIDRAKTGTPWSSKTKKEYTIILLNNCLRYCDGAWFHNLIRDPSNQPPRLRPLYMHGSLPGMYPNDIKI